MSYANIAAQNAPPLSQQPKPDASLLQGPVSSSSDSIARGSDEEVGSVSDKVNIVDASEAALLREALANADQPDPNTSRRFETAKVEIRKVAGEVKKSSPPSTKTASGSSSSNARQKGDKLKEIVGEEVDRFEKGAQTFAKKVEKISEEIKKDVKEQGKKAEKKGREFEKEARVQAKRYPIAASGIVGVVNLAVVASVGYVAYQNWNKTWNRQTVALTSVGLLSLFGAESYLGYYGYEKDAAESKKTLPKA